MNASNGNILLINQTLLTTSVSSRVVKAADAELVHFYVSRSYISTKTTLENFNLHLNKIKAFVVIFLWKQNYAFYKVIDCQRIDTI